MKGSLVTAISTSAFAVLTALACAQAPSHCTETGPPSVWVIRSPYPFQAGSERSFDELYHGPWKTQVDIPVYTRPRNGKIAGTIKAGTTVDALLGESIVVHPLRLAAAQDFEVTKGMVGGKRTTATVRKGDFFWVLNSGGEGEFSIWWHCSAVGWDSTEPSDVDDSRSRPLGSNQEQWVKIKDPRTGLCGWFKDIPVHDLPQLIPAQPTTKSTG